MPHIAPKVPMSSNEFTTTRLRKYSGAVHLRTSDEVLTESKTNSITICPEQDLFLRVIIQYARITDAHKRRNSLLTRFDSWCTERKNRQYLLFWMCVERFQNLEWKAVQKMMPVNMTLKNESCRILNDFIRENAEFSIRDCGIVDAELKELENAVHHPTFDMFRYSQSKLFNNTLLNEFKEFWDANPTIHTSIESSERATDGEVVMACNQFLSEYYDFGLSDEESLTLEINENPPTITQATWRCMISRMCSSPTS